MIVRFTKNGCGYDPKTRTCLSKGTNVIYHPVFWGVTKEWAESIAEEHGVKMIDCGGGEDQ